MKRHNCLHAVLPFLTLLAFLTSHLTAAESWQRLGPDYQPGEGTTVCLSAHPQRANEWVVGARPGGLLFTADGGGTWKHASETFDEEGHIGPNMQSLGRSASHPEVLYAGIEKLGVRRSDDGGQTWRDVAAGLPKGRARNGVASAVHPSNPDIAWLGTDGGLFKTLDGGQTWRRLTAGLPSGKTGANKDVSQTVTRIIVDHANPQRLWISLYATGLNEPAGVWLSEDGGDSWKTSGQGIETGSTGGPLPLQQDMVMALDRCAAEPDVFCCTTLMATYRSTDGAKTWTKLPRKLGGGAIAVHPRNALLVVAAAPDGRVEASRDGGQTWTDVSSGLRLGREPNAPVRKVDFVGPDGKKQVLEGTLHRYHNQIESFAFDPTDPSVLYACAHAGLYRLKITP